MSTTFDIETIDEIVLVRFKPGSLVAFETVMQAVKLERSVEDRVGKDDIWDIRDCEISEDMNFDSINRIIGYLQSDDVHLQNTRTAVLVNDAVQFGTTRIFQSLSDELPSKVQIFKEMEEALAWLKD